MSYTIKTLIFTAILVFITYLFVLSVDPYDKEGIDYWNIGTKAVSSAREYKFTHLDSGRNNYKAFIVGSSRVLRMDPELIEKYTGLPTYNYGVENANAEDLLAEVMHVVDKQKPEMIVLFLDFYMMNGYTGTDKRLVQSRLSKYLDKKSTVEKDDFKLPYFHTAYLTMRALKDSFNLVLFSDENRGGDIYLKNGQHIKEEPEEEPKLAVEYFSNQYNSYRKDKVRLEMFAKIKTLCRKNNVKLIVSQTPMNNEHLKKVLEDPKLREMFIIFKKEISSIFGGFYDFNNFSVSAYGDKKFWYDSVHPSENLTQIMIDKLFDSEKNNSNSKFGRFITPSEIEEYVRQF